MGLVNKLCADDASAGRSVSPHWDRDPQNLDHASGSGARPKGLVLPQSLDFIFSSTFLPQTEPVAIVLHKKNPGLVMFDCHYMSTALKYILFMVSKVQQKHES